MSAVKWWLDLVRRGDPCAVLAAYTFIGVSRVLGDEGRRSEEALKAINITAKWHQSRDASELVEYVDRQIMHPRLVLLPLLMREGTMCASLAFEALKHCRKTTEHVPIDDAPLTKRQAQMALGIKQSHMTHFVERGLLDFDSGLHAAAQMVSKAATNKILCDVSCVKTADGVPQPLTMSLAAVVQEIEGGQRVSGGFDQKVGLTSLRTLKQFKSAEQRCLGYLDLEQTAARIGAYDAAVRSVIEFGWLKAEQVKTPGHPKKLMCLQADVDAFNQTFVFGGVLARTVGQNSTNFTEKLKAVGVEPVAGPTIDGSLLYLFRREDLVGVNLEELRDLKRYPTATGRRPAYLPPSKPDSMTLVEAANQLEIPWAEALLLVRQGRLKPSGDLSREWRVTIDSVQTLQNLVGSHNWITIDKAALLLGVSRVHLEHGLAVHAGASTIHLGSLRLITREDLRSIRELKSQYYTAKEAGAIFGLNRSHLPNMENRGEIASKEAPSGSSPHLVRLYAKKDVDRIFRDWKRNESVE
ncbi:hypothetical protein [Cupriavidus consociatus]|uniref:hypothetical protein n=1 Tax=Cupriavidus consociatus TaxID=2821357 RepID=UPI001FD7DF19|nr:MULTISPECIES: hypothetical protein [unclassified Cupriavidus]MDK2659619.1 hypothetical protein [Cupriavidus sp. LEh21]